MNINDQIFSEAKASNGKYEKAKVLSIINDLVGENKLDEGDETLINFMIQECNDHGKTDLSLLQFANYIASHKSNLASKSVMQKLNQNPDFKSQYETYLREKTKSNRKFFGALIFVAALSAVLLLWKFDYLKNPFSSTSAGAIVVLDVDKLAYSATAHLMEKKMTPEATQAYGNEYRKALADIIEGYLDDGYVIVNRYNVYAYGKKQDITEDVLKKLGLPVVEDEEYQTKYNSGQRYDVLKNFASANITSEAEKFLNDKQSQFNNSAQVSLDKADVITGSNGQSIDLE